MHFRKVANGDIWFFRDLSYNKFPSSDKLKAIVLFLLIRIASSEKHTQFKTRVKNTTLLETEMAKIVQYVQWLFLTKTVEKTFTLYSRTYLYGPYKSITYRGES